MQIGLSNTVAGAGPSLNVVLCHQIRGSLGANTVSSIAGGIGIIILIINLKKSSAYIYRCRDIYENDICFVASVSAVCISCGKTKILGLNLSKTPSLPFHEHNPFLQPQSHNAVFWRLIPRDVPASFPCPPSWILQGWSHLLWVTISWLSHVSSYRNWSWGWAVMKTRVAVRECTSGTPTLSLYLSFWLLLVVIQQEVVAMILFLTILGFCSAVSLTVYGIGEVIEGNKVGGGLRLNPKQ